MSTDHKKYTTTAIIDEVREVALAYAKVAAGMVSHEGVQRMMTALRSGATADVHARCVPFSEEYPTQRRRENADVDAACNAAFAIDSAARTLDEHDAYEARFYALSAQNRATIVAMIDARIPVDVNSDRGRTCRDAVDRAAAEYVSAEKIAKVLA